MMRRLQREDGFTMFTAIVLSAIVLVLATLAAQLSIHNLSLSGQDRQRLEAITAAEAGLDYYYGHLGGTNATGLSCSVPSPATAPTNNPAVTQDLTSSPATTFKVWTTYYDSSSAALTCAQVTGGSVTPSYVKILSIGTPTGLSYPARKMEAYVRLIPRGSGSFPNTAIMASSSLNLAANTQVFGNQGYDADLYAAGDLSLGATSNQIRGSVYAQGAVTMQGGAVVSGSVWALNALSMQGNSSIGGNATSSNSTISVSNNSHVYGDAKAGSTITAASGTISGTRYPNTANIGAPPTQTYPTYTYNSADWTGYTIQSFSGTGACTSAATAITNWTTGNLVVRLSGLGAPPCTLNPPTKVLPGSLAVITDGPMTFTTRTYWTTTGGPYQVYLFVGLAGVNPYCDFATQANSGIGANLPTLIYVPQGCSLNLASNTSLAQGQLFGGSVNVSANTSFQYKPVQIPGKTAPGFLQDALYQREIA